MAKLGELYTELTVKDGGFAQGMANAKTAAEKLQGEMDKLATKAKWAFAGLAAGVGLTVKAAGEAEGANLRLKTALDLAGDGTVEQYQNLVDLASALQKTTVYDDEVTKGVMTYALQLGVAAPKVGELTKQAMGLASALGMDLQTAMRGLILAQNGEFAALSRYIPALRTATTDAAKLDAVNKLAARGFAMTSEETKTLAGRLAQLKNDWGELAEQIGAVFLPVAKEFIAWLRDMLPKIQEWVAANAETVLGFTKWAAIISVVVASGGVLNKLITGILSLAAAYRTLAGAQAAAGAAGMAGGGGAVAGGAAAAGGIGAVGVLGVAAGFGALLYGAYQLGKYLGGLIVGVDKATDSANAFADSLEPDNAIYGVGGKAEVEKNIKAMAEDQREHFRFMGPNPNQEEYFPSEPRPVFNRDGSVGRFRPTPGGIQRTSGEDRSGGFVGVADLANRLQMAAFDTKAAEDKARAEALLKETQAQTDQMNKMIQLMEDQKLGLAIT